ncbi:gluconeogenesis factor YvcK family protein, partial [Virgibacillus salexigens]|uniref:gluconeogenesis factor YvcK family protein n=1 Tax=Virgibacillus salexigens TaxID=61016 RepID=UPI0030821113
KIYRISNDNMSLHARMTDGTVVSGESNIPLSNKKIEGVFLSPQPVQPLPNAVRALKKPDLIVLAPGSLYTSIMPTIIMPQIDEAVRETSGKVVYVCNVMTQA